MIVKMKKIHLIVQKKDVKTALRGLRNNGTVHIEHLNKTQEQKLDELQVEIEDLKRVINVLRCARAGLNLGNRRSRSIINSCSRSPRSDSVNPNRPTNCLALCLMIRTAYSSRFS